jgi:hypothetical protein
VRKALPALALLIALTNVGAVETGETRIDTVGRSATDAGRSDRLPTEVSRTDVLEAGYWGITLEELHRARHLMRGPRGAFSDPRISPVEVLGIHARSDAERDRYAALFAKLLHEDTDRVLAWQRAGDTAMRRLYPTDKVVDFSFGRPAGVGQTLPNWFFSPGGSAQ